MAVVGVRGGLKVSVGPPGEKRPGSLGGRVVKVLGVIFGVCVVDVEV